MHRGPWFVAAKDAASNTLFVTTRYEDVTAPRLAFGVDDVNWIAGKPPAALATAALTDEPTAFGQALGYVAVGVVPH